MFLRQVAVFGPCRPEGSVAATDDQDIEQAGWKPVVPGLGQLDDLAVLLFGVKLFIELAPPAVVREHLLALGARIKEWRVVEEEEKEPPVVIEGEGERHEVVGLAPLAVVPSHQKKGIGKRLIEHALGYMKSMGMEHARIDTIEQNPVAMSYYPKLGFKEITRRIHYIMPLPGQGG